MTRVFLSNQTLTLGADLMCHGTTGTQSVTTTTAGPHRAHLIMKGDGEEVTPETDNITRDNLPGKTSVGRHGSVKIAGVHRDNAPHRSNATPLQEGEQ